MNFALDLIMAAENVLERQGIFEAAFHGRTDIIKTAMDSVRARNPEAADSSVAKLISTGRAEDGATPLHVASSLGHTDVIRALLHAGATLSARASSGDFAGKRPYEVCSGDAAMQAYHVFLFEAVAMNKAERVAALLEGNVPPNILDGGSQKETLLHWACSFGHVDGVRVLLEHGCDPNILNMAQEGPLHTACKGAHAAIVDMLLQEGAYPADVDYEVLAPSKPVPEVLELLRRANEPSFEAACPLRAVHDRRVQAEAREAALREDSSQDHEFSLVEWDDERIARKSAKARGGSVGSDADSGADGARGVGAGTGAGAESDDEEDEDDFLARQPLLVLWPPVQRQRRARGRPLILHSSSIVYISVLTADIDVFPLLTWSGLMDTFDSFGLTAQVKRSVSGSSLSLCIDRSICPRPHQFELVITEERCSLVAADQTGLLYSVYAFIQLLQLHSEIAIVENGRIRLSNGSSLGPAPGSKAAEGAKKGGPVPYSASNGGILNGTAISLFPLVLKDWPDIPNRVVMWSHRYAARLDARIIRNMIQLLSKLRINMMHLVVDCFESGTARGVGVGDNTANRIGTTDIVASSDNTKLFAIFEVCSRHCVELVPTIVISRLHQSMDIDMMRNCNSRTMNIIFLYEQRQVAAEISEALTLAQAQNESSDYVNVNGVDIKRQKLTTQAIEEAICKAIVNVLQQAQLAGFNSVSIGASAWTQRAADPLRIASNLGLAAILHDDLDVVYPKALFTKPVVSAQCFASTISRCTARARGEAGYDVDITSSVSGCSLSVFPAYMDSDFMTPTLLLKYFSFLHAGFAWNGSAMKEMELGITDTTELDSHGNSGGCAAIIKEVVGLLLFPASVQQSLAGSTPGSVPRTCAIEAETLTAVMAIFTGDILSTEGGAETDRSSSSSSSGGGSPRNSSQRAESDTLSYAETPTRPLPRNNSGGFIVNSASPPLTPFEKPVVTNYGAYGNPTSADLVRVERTIWSLITAQASVADAQVPSKRDSALCLRYCRRALNTSKWASGLRKGLLEKWEMSGVLGSFASSIGTGTKNTKDSDGSSNNEISACKADIDELFACITVMSVVSRAIVLSHNKLAKDPSWDSANSAHLTLEQLLQCLPLGTTSDVANSLLEAVEQCTGLWRRRFENLAFSNSGAFAKGNVKVPGAVSLSTKGPSGLTSVIGSGKAINTVEGAALTYLTQQHPSLPCRAFFEVLNLQRQEQQVGQIEKSFLGLFAEKKDHASTN